MKRLFFLLFLLTYPIYKLSGQVVHDYSGYKPKMNLVKVNLTSIPIRNYLFQYERVLSKSISLAISYGTIPEGNIPLKKQILKFADNDEETERIFNSFMLTSYSVTPEIRFYTGKKGYGRGFYLAPFYRNAGYEGSNFLIDFDDEFGNNQTIDLSGKIKSNTFGILIGAQWSLSKHLVLDWWILGPHYGTGKGSFDGVSSRPLSQSEQQDLRQSLEDIDIPMVDKTINVTSNGATMDLDGFWGGLRAGISFGFKF